jgi:hypothetical protein
MRVEDSECKTMQCAGFPHAVDCLRSWLARTEISAILNYIDPSAFQQYFIRRLQQSGLKAIFVFAASWQRQLAGFRFATELESGREVCNNAVNNFSQSIHDPLTLLSHAFHHGVIFPR